MSRFNDANEVASEVVFGRCYQGNELCPRPEGISEHAGMLHGTLRIGGMEIDLTGRPVSHETWAGLAIEIENYLLGLATRKL